MSRDWKIAVGVVCFLAVALFGVVRSSARDTEPLPVVPPEQPAEVLATTPEQAPIELPPAEPSSEVPTLGEAAEDHVDERAKVLAGELSKMWTTDPEELVRVIDEASRRATVSPSVTLLLAIAHAETNGKILDVSEAGAVGLAQATPIACRLEKCQGKLYVTRDYLIGARAYIMKKPLGDADTIASLIVTRDNAKTRKRARRLLDSAFALRLEGVNELDLLDPFASDAYFKTIAAAKKHNLKRLKELRSLLDRGASRTEIRRYRDRVRKEYRDLKREQFDAWARYQNDLIAKRDRMLARHFGLPASTVKKTMAYEAGEYLAKELDLRFSAGEMASFLVQHLERKAEEARKLARRKDDVEEMTAALYNGGSHNVKRMIAGLIVSLPETEKYKRKVPATRRRLDRSVQDLATPLRRLTV
jgi:hypothetical protein